MDLKNVKAYMESKKQDLIYIDQIKHYLTDMAKPLPPHIKVEGRDIDMLTNFHGRIIITDFKHGKEHEKYEDDWYLSYREICLNGNVVFLVSIDTAGDLATMSQAKILFQKWETEWIPCSFGYYLALNHWLLKEFSKIDYDRDRILKPIIKTKAEFEDICLKQGIPEFYTGKLYH